MIRQLSIANFKAFGNLQQVPLRPLTLIFGPNSGGKSSILHSLKWSKHAVKFKALDFEASGDSDDSPDFGGFLGAVFGKNRERNIRLEFQLPSGHAPDFRVSFQIGLWTRERKEKVLPAPQPPDQIKNYLAIEKAFRTAKIEANLEVVNAPWVLDDEGNPVRDEKGELVGREDFGEGIFGSGQQAEKIREEWQPRLAALWQEVKEEFYKPGIEEALDRYHERCTQNYDLREREEGDPVIFDFEIALGNRSLLRAERTSFGGGARLTKVSKVLSEVWQYIGQNLNDDSAATDDLLVPAWDVTHFSQILNIDDLWKDDAWSQDELTDCGEIEFLGLLPSLLNRSALSTHRDSDIALSGMFESLEGLIQECRRRMEQDLGKGTYLGPLRALPPRSLLMLGKEEKLGAVATAWLRLRNEDQLRDQVNRWIGSDNLDLGYCYETQIFAELASTLDIMINGDHCIRTEFSWEYSKESHEEGYKERWLPSWFDPNEDEHQTVKFWADKLPQTMRDLLLRDLRNNVVVSSRDVGIGISQLIPIVVHALAERESMIVVEQPELHLHPALQAKLGDLFIESALGPNRNQFILETHSEHLILRILRRIRETTDNTLPFGKMPIRPADVAVLYVQPGENGSEVIELPVTEDGDFSVPWPGGFFADRADELF